MIASLTGTIEDYTDNGIVLNVNGIGFDVQTGSEALQILSGKGRDELVHLYTYMNVGREGDFTLFGFLSKEELKLFRQLITVSGIGPKGALSLLSVMSADDLIFAILSGDAKTISRAPGIGKKTAERLVIDLRDKLELRTVEDLENNPYAAGAGLGENTISGGLTGRSGAGAEDSAAADAVEALTALGYARLDAVKAVKQAKAVLSAESGDVDAGTGSAEQTAGPDTESLLKAALQFMV